MTHIKAANIMACAEVSRKEALETIQRMTKKAEKASNPREALNQGMDLMREVWVGRTVGLMTALPDCYQFHQVKDENGRPAAALVVAGHSDLVDRISALVREHARQPDSG